MKAKTIFQATILSCLLFACGDEATPSTNISPNADAGPDLSIDEQSEITIYGNGMDSDGSIVHYNWSQISGPSIVISNQTSNTLNFTSPLITTTTVLSLELTVTDNEGSTATDSVNVTINTVGSMIYVPEDYSTIDDAITSASSGDKVIVNTGVYTETNSINIDKDLVIASTYIFTQNHNDISNTVIIGDSLNKLFTVINGADVIFEGLTIENTYKPITIDNGNGNIRHNIFKDNTSDSISFEADSSGIAAFNEIINSGDDGIDIDGLRGPYTVRGNSIVGSSDDGMEFRMISSYLVTKKIQYEIYENIIDGAGGDGIQLIDYPDDNLNLREINIHNNYIKNVMFAAVGTMPDTMTIRTNLPEIYPNFTFKELVFVTNNTFINNDNGISGGDNFIVINNIIADNRLGITNIDGDSIVDYMMFFNNDLIDIPSSAQGSNICFDNPMLNPDGSLSNLSPSIDAGVSNYIWQNETVLDIKKFNGTNPDLGWLEFVEL